MRVFHHLYVSHAASSFTEVELEKIGAECADGYRQVGMTGILLYGCGVFIELLEGDPHYVDFMRDTIRSDARHTNYTLIAEGPAAKRVFQDWTMHVLNSSPVGRDRVLDEAICLQRYLAFVTEKDISRRTLAVMKFFRERLTELPQDEGANAEFFARGGQAAPPAPKPEPEGEPGEVPDAGPVAEPVAEPEPPAAPESAMSSGPTERPGDGAVAA